jgi:hypothetical protein
MFNSNDIPSEYKPLSAWEYFWLTILFNIPFIGFVFLIFFSFDSSNINRRNFARSFFCIIVILIIIFIALICLGISLPTPAQVSSGNYF